MGFLDFMKNVGANIFGKGKNEEEEIAKLLNQDLPGKISNLSVKFKNGVVELSGNCDTQATKEKAVLIAGNVKGVEKVGDTGLTAPRAEEQVEYYTIVSGDTLSKIAKRFYGDGKKYPVIFEANREVIKDANLIYPGQKIRIPKL